MAIKLRLLFALMTCACFSQTPEKLPLKSLLDQIAATHHIHFGYIAEELVVYMIAPPPQTLSLQKKLEYIESHTRLQFRQVAPNYYSIFNDHKMDKPLCGFLTDGKTGIGIENAHIVVSGTNVSVASDSRGYFELPELTPNTLSVRHQGYLPLQLNPAELYVPDCPMIKMDAVVQELGEVLAKRYLATGISLDNLGQLIVKPSKFGILPGLTEPDVLQTMQQIPGIISTDETVANVSVRGGTHDQNLFLWNGIRMFQTGHLFGLLSAFNPLPASEIRISKNGSSAFFGESVSSVVEIVNRHLTDSTYTIVAADMINADFVTNLKLSGNATLQVAGRRAMTDFFESPTYEKFEQRIFQNTIVTDVAQQQQVPISSDQEFYFYDASLQYRQKLGSRHQLTVDGIAIENNVDIFQRSGSNERISRLSQRNLGGSVDWKTQWNATQLTEIQGYVSRYELAGVNDAIATGQLTRQKNSVFDKSIRVKHSAAVSDNVKISAGYQFNQISVGNFDEVNAPEFSRNSVAVLRSHVAAAEADFVSKDKKLSVRGGVRANYFDKFSLLLTEPRIAAGYSVSDKLTLTLLAEQKSQTLSQVIDQQQDFLGIEKRRWTLADNAEIPVQRSTQIAVGTSFASNRWFLTLDNFYKRISGITSDAQGFQNQFEFSYGTGNYGVYGSEILVQKSFRRFYTWVSYSFNHNRYEFKSFAPAEFDSNFSIAHAVSAAAIYEWHHLRVAVGAKWHTGRLYTEPSSYEIDPNNAANSAISYRFPNSSALDDFFQINFSASKTWQINKAAFTASASVLNLLDGKNLNNRYYRINRENNNVESVNSYGLGRTPNLSVKVRF